MQPREVNLKAIILLLNIMLSLFVSGCSQVNLEDVGNEEIRGLNEAKEYKEQVVEGLKGLSKDNYTTKDDYTSKLYENERFLLKRAREVGFNSEILEKAYEDLKSNPTDAVKILRVLEFHLNALTDSTEVTELNETHKQIADELAVEIRKIGPINHTFFENYNTFRRQTYRINHLASTLNDIFGTNFPKIEPSKDNFDKIRKLRKTMTYIPLIDSYNSLYRSSKNLPSDNEEDYKRFYKNLFLFMAEFAFIEQKVGYKIAFKSTGKLAKAVKLSKSKSVLGTKGYGLLLSEIHWKIRLEIHKGWSDLLEALEQAQIIQLKNKKQNSAGLEENSSLLSREFKDHFEYFR